MQRFIRVIFAVIVLSFLMACCSTEGVEHTGKPEPLLGLKIVYDYSGKLGIYGIADKAQAYDENGILVGEAQCLGIEEIPGAEVGANLIVEETQYERDGSGKVVYKGKIVFYTQTGQVTSEETIQGSKRYNIFNGWPMGW